MVWTREMAQQKAEERAFLTHLDHEEAVEGCRHCAVRPMLSEIYHRWVYGTRAEHDLIWSMQDGYGEAGFMPPQGHDWSGIRDSKPATIRAIYEALLGAIGPVVV